MAYHIRWQGQVTGPYEAAQILQMLDSGKITRMHQLSTDRRSWRQLSECEELQTPKSESMPPPPPTLGIPGRREMLRVGGRPPELKTKPRTEEGPTWSLDRNGREAGPFNQSQLFEMLARGQVQLGDVARMDSEVEWRTLGDFPQFQTPIAWQSAAEVTGDALPCYPSLVARTTAFLLDLVLIALAGGSGVLLSSLLGQNLAGTETRHVLVVIVAGIYLCWVYHALMEASIHQATLGKIALGIRVTDESGMRLTLGRASLRFFAKLLSVLPCGLGCLVAVLTQRRQALHDLLAGTLVVSKSTTN